MNIVEPIRDPKKILAIKRILREEENPRNYLLFVAGVNLALRISDLLSLRVKDILDKQGNIKEFIHLKERKTKRQVKIKLNNTVKEALNYFLDKARITDPEQYLFKSERGNRALDRIRAWGLIQKWTKEVGLEGEQFGTHTLRKTWGYQARKQGVSIEKINEKLGHKSVEVTKRYIGITQEEINLLEDEICI
ncbi:Tyrosine recombinase XerC [subsurface metagenome]